MWFITVQTGMFAGQEKNLDTNAIHALNLVLRRCVSAIEQDVTDCFRR